LQQAKNIHINHDMHDHRVKSKSLVTKA